ncbi:hypothetical protein R1flu_011559 [Riccia fluitans]|uniref:DDE Tnp4 domain-containing protein n=1 Tax=Riccia fluitans TaxID=41844 RepID=A0ABD1ZBF0_9MARC
MGIPAVPRFSGFQWAPMRPMPAYVFPAGPVSAAAGSTLVYSGNLTLMSGSSVAVTSVLQSFLSSMPVPAATTSPSVDSARAESMDVEGGGEAALDGNGGAGSQGARRISGRRRTRPPTPRDSNKLTWTDEWVACLLELKKQEHLASEAQSGCDVIVTAETKLKKLQARLTARGCNAETSQIWWKWDSLFMKYKSVKAYMKRTGVAPFATLTKAERKVENLPLDFNTSWFDMIESWYNTNPHVDPPCLADSSNPFLGLETTRDQEETDITECDEPGPSTHRTNSSQKRKTVSKSTQVISDCIGKFNGILLENESRREDRGNRKMQILDEVESKRIALDERRVAVEERRIEIEDRRVSEESQRAKELVGALTSVATAITSKRVGVPDDIQLLLVILAKCFLLVQELLATLLSTGARPVGSTLLSTSDMELEPEAIEHFTVAIGITFTLLSSCLRDSQEWWVRQRSLVWFDDYLQRAYGGQWHTYFYVSDRFGIGESTLAEIFYDCIDAINQILGPLFLPWPLPDEIGAVADAFFRRSGLPNITGAIDGTHVQIRTPHLADNPVPYYNRKKYHSIALQAVVDADGCFLDVSVGFPGSTNDQRLLTFSGLYNQVCNGSRLHWPVYRINGGFRLRPYLLGDSGYAHTPWLMVLFPQNAQLTEMEALYNEHHVRGYLTVEQAFGHLKGKFRILDLGVNSSISSAAKIAYSCCVLNNVLVKYRVGLWQKNVQPTYDRSGATLVQHLHDDRFTVQGNRHQGSDSELARETREQLGHFLALN